VKWRTGSEARISHLKRDYGWARTRVDGIAGAQTWCGWGVLAHNSAKVAGLLKAKDDNTARRSATKDAEVAGPHPPGRRRRSSQHGLVRPSFIPPRPTREQRDLTRHRKSVIEERGREAQRLHKVLEDAGVKLSSVLTKSGREMIDALIAGQRDPEMLASSKTLWPGASTPFTASGESLGAPRPSEAIKSSTGSSTGWPGTRTYWRSRTRITTLHNASSAAQSDLWRYQPAPPSANS